MTLEDMENRIIELEKKVHDLTLIIENKSNHSLGRKKKLSAEQEAEIVMEIKTQHTSYRKLAERYNVSPSTISNTYNARPSDMVIPVTTI